MYLLTPKSHSRKGARWSNGGRDGRRIQPDVVILDIGMSGMNGYTVAQTLRKKPKASSLALVALSGLGQQEDKARAAEAGFDHHYTKRVDINSLRAFLAATAEALAE